MNINDTNYDSTLDTLKHRHEVQKIFHAILKQGIDRIEKHDESKLSHEEKPYFDKATPKLKQLKFPSPEYDASLKDIETALEHHYRENRHHPQHFVEGIKGMNLVDVIEMFCDWAAAVKRHENGDIMTSIEANKKRFAMSDDLAAIFQNTAVSLKDWTG